MDSLGRNITLPIYNADGTSFHGLELKKFTFDSVVMALGDKITGELYYPSNTLSVNQTEYVVYDGVKYYLINPPTIVKEGMKADNGTAKGMTKYSFTFYHPMFMLYNFPFTDVAVTSSEEKYKSQDKNFFWIGNLVDYVAKLNKNLQGTEWVVEIGSNVPVQDKNKLSEVLSFNDQKIADALKTGYDTWEIPYIIDIIASTDSRYAQGKRFLIRYGLPSQEILVENAQHQLVPYVFQMGQGVGLKNDSRTPKNNKIVTRIAGYGSEDNVPFGYPQILWTGNQTWNYTINNSASAPNSYPIYDGIVAGQRVRLIHHPFTRSHLMPTIYADTVNKKVNPYASGYDPTIEIKDYYDAVNDSSWTYPNQIIPYAPSYEIHEFSDIKPELGEKHIVSAEAFDGDAEKKYLTLSEGLDQLMKLSSETNIDVERGVIRLIHDKVESGTSGSGHQEDIRYVFKWSVDVTTDFIYVKFASSNINFEMEIHRTNSFPSAPWDDAMDDDGNYKQSYFNVTLPPLDFDLYACAAVTQEMTINMRSGACLGCSFPIEVDWEDYKANFYDSDGNFAPTGSQRNYDKYPDSSAGYPITVICKKEIDTFGTLMPNIYQQPKANDKFVILGISLPTSYITNAQLRLDHDMHQYMLDNNVHYFEWPLKFDEFFLANHTNILAQMKPNILVRFNFASEQHELYIKQISVKYGEKPLPQYNITLTDDIEIVLSPIGRVTDEVSSLRVLFGGGGSGSGDVNLDLLSEYFLSKQNDDTAAGMIRFMRGLQVGENFVTGLLGEGGIFRVDDDGTTYIEADKLYIRMRAYFDTVEVKKYLHSGGNRIASKAGINCSRVEWIDANGDVTNVLEDTVKFRCYFRANGENGREITNDFVVNDLAFCKETNVDNTSIQQHGYWRCVIGVSSSPNEAGEHWIDLSKSDCQSGSNIPLAQDDIIQLGHKTDNTRQGAIVEFVGGEDAPSYQIYQGINSYDLTDKNYVRFGYDSQSGGAQAYIGKPDNSTYIWYHKVNGEWHLDIKANVQFTSPESSYGTQDLNAFISAVTGDINNIHDQIDGTIETWFYDGEPTLNNLPASQWTSSTDKDKHLGDLYYDNQTGYGYRFAYDESVTPAVYKWIKITDVDVVKALADAAKAQDTADHKRRVFVAQPAPVSPKNYVEYDIGDLWVNATNPSGYTGETDEANHKYNNDCLRCITAKPIRNEQGQITDGTFKINDWQLASKYTDDTELRNFLGDYEGTAEDLKQQIDKKAETWYQDEDPSLDWYVVNPQTHEVITDVRSEHVGDLWYCTAPVSATPPDYYDAVHGGNKTWQYKYNESTSNYYWAYQNVPVAVFDRIDGKAQLFVQIPNVANPNDDGYCYRKDDMWILEDDNVHSPEKAGELMVATQSSTSYNSLHWVKKLKYTDDLDAFIESYVQDLTGINTNITNAQTTANNAATAAGAAQTTADNAIAAAAAADYLRQALTQATDIVGGLVLATTIGLRDSSNNVWSGISGAYQASETGTGYKGHGIAAWYGGGMVDHEVTPSASNYAKSLFRFDGSGYVSSGNISWDKDGGLTIKGDSITAATELKVAGSDVLTQTTADARYVTIDWFRSLFRAYNSNDTELTPNNSTTGLDSIKAMVGFWTESYISALGQGSSGGGGGISLNEPLLSINQAGLSAPTTNGSVLVFSGGTWKYSSNTGILTPNLTVTGSVTASSITSANGFIVGGKNDTYVLLAGGGTKPLSEIGGGSVNGIKIGTSATEYTPDASGFITLPQYPDTSGFVRGITFNGGNPLQPISGNVALGGLTTVVKVGSTSYNVSATGVVELPAYPSLTLTAATTSALGGVKVNASFDTAVSVQASGNSNTRNYGLQIDSTGKAFVYVPWTDNYLPLSGGTMSDKAVIARSCESASVSWYQGRLYPIIKTTSYTGYNSILSMKTTDGSWELGVYTSNTAYLTYITDTNYNQSKNECTYQLIFPKTSGTLAITSQIPTKVSELTNDSGYVTTDTNTWRTVQCNGVSIGSNVLNLVASTNVSISANNGTLTFSATDTNTWRTIQSNGVSIGDNTLNLKNGTNVSISNSNGTLTISASSYSVFTGATASANGASGLVPAPTTSQRGYFLKGSGGWGEPTDTKNTTGAVISNGTKLFIVGSSQAGTAMSTNINEYCYVGSDNQLYSAGKAVVYNSADFNVTEGRVYIGTTTTNTSYKLDVVGNVQLGAGGPKKTRIGAGNISMTNENSTSYNVMAFSRDSSSHDNLSFGYGLRSLSGSGTYIYGRTIYFNTAGTERVRINDTGLWIGKTDAGSYKLFANGAAGGISAWANTSDMRQKDYISELNVPFTSVMQAPLFRFTWKDRSIDTKVHIGTSAQYWRNVVPELITDGIDGFYAMEYGTTALVAAIATAKKVQEHELRIQALERENAYLKNELKRLIA